jgi:glycogen synthase
LTDDPSLQALIDQRGLRGRVTLAGSRTQAELGSLFRNYDIFAFPTWPREPFAFAPLEASAHGCVSLISANCGNAEWFVDGVHCLKATRDVNGFANRLIEIFEGRIDLKLIARRAQVTIARDFHISAVLPKIEAVLARAAHEGRFNAARASEVYAIARYAERLLSPIVDEAHAD